MRYILIFVLIILNIAWLDPYKDRMREGNSLYQNGDYPQADAAYNKATEYLPSEKERAFVEFNIGDAKYKAQDYDGAIGRFQSALDTDDEELQKKAFFNLGNAYYQKGDKEKALESWMNALKLDPEYTKAQMNIEKLFEEEEEKNKQQQQQKEKSDQKKDDSRQNNDQNQNGQNSEEENQEQNQSRSEHKKGDKIEQELSKEQIDNILQQFRVRPLERKDGERGNSGRVLENDW